MEGQSPPDIPRKVLVADSQAGFAPVVARQLVAQLGRGEHAPADEGAAPKGALMVLGFIDVLLRGKPKGVGGDTVFVVHNQRVLAVLVVVK